MARSTSAAAMGGHSSSTGAAGGGGGVTQLEFTQAMNDFKVMFPDMDSDVIEAVLRANHGAVDATIDHLLAMSADNETEKALHPHPQEGTTSSSSASPPARRTADGPPAYPPQNPPSYQQATQDEDLINLDVAAGSVAAAAAAAARSPETKEPPLDLLSDMGAAGGGSATAGDSSSSPSQQHQQHPTLSTSPKHSYTHPSRQEEEEEASTSESGHYIPTQEMLQYRYEENLKAREQARTNPEATAAAGNDAQYLEDERLALMMQNEEFMAELRNDREFLSTLEAEAAEFGDADYYGGGGSSAVDGAAGGGGGGAGTGAGGPPSSSSARGGRFQSYNRSKSLVMDEALFREKLKTMGKTSKRKFAQLAGIFSRRKGAKQLLGNPPAPSNDHLLLNAEPLVAQGESDEEKEKEEEEVASKTPTKGKYMSLS